MIMFASVAFLTKELCFQLGQKSKSTCYYTETKGTSNIQWVWTIFHDRTTAKLDVTLTH